MFQDLVMQELNDLADNYGTILLDAIKEAFENTPPDSTHGAVIIRATVQMLEVTKEIDDDDLAQFDGVTGVSGALAKELRSSNADYHYNLCNCGTLLE